MTVWNDYFDWYNLFVNEVAGSPVLFIFLSYAIIAFSCISFKFSNEVSFTILVLWGLLMSAFFGFILGVILFLVGAFFYWGLSKMIKD